MKKPLKVAAWCGLFFLVISLATTAISIMSYFAHKSTGLTVTNLVLQITSISLLIVFIYGFYELGKKTNNEFLSIMSIIGIVLLSIYLVFFMVFSLLMSLASPNSGPFLSPGNGESIMNPGEIIAIITVLGIFFIFISFLMTLPFAIYAIVFGVSIRKSKNEVELAGATGTLLIISGATYFLLIGFLLNYIVVILGTIMLFKASKKFENGK